MTQKPEIALILSTFQRPDLLRRALLSIAMQKGAEGKIELVVTDDGSVDETADIVEGFARSANFPVSFTTHKHNGFQLARCRNEGVAASIAPYLLFLDGDCVFPADHIALHLKHRLPRTVISGDCCRLAKEASDQITESTIQSGEFEHHIPTDLRRTMARRHQKAVLYSLIRHPFKPKLVGNNIALWRSDYERVNGYDEKFVGWGCEDDDLGLRLRQAGLRVKSILGITYPYHLWHPPVPSNPECWKKSHNVAYLKRKYRPTRSSYGLKKLSQESHSLG